MDRLILTVRKPFAIWWRNFKKLTFSEKGFVLFLWGGIIWFAMTLWNWRTEVIILILELGFTIIVVSAISLIAMNLWQKGRIPKWAVVPFGICGLAFGLHHIYWIYNKYKYHPDPDIDYILTGMLPWCVICIMAIKNYWGDFRDRWLTKHDP